MKGKTIKVYVTGFYQDDWAMLEDIKRYGFGQASWKNLEFVCEGDYDEAVVITAPYNKHQKFVRSKTTQFLNEPPCFMMHRDMECVQCPQYLPMAWWVKSDRYELFDTERSFNTFKRELFSTVTSGKRFWDGHIKRSKFNLALDALVEEGLDIYGRNSRGELLNKMKNYRGPLDDKFDGLIPYKYHLTCENSFIPEYYTEKIVDPIVSETLCFYDGCTNLEEYIDERAFIRYDVTQIESSIEKIFAAIRNDEYSKRYPYILAMKKRMLTELNPLNIIWAQLNGKDMPDYFKL